MPAASFVMVWIVSLPPISRLAPAAIVTTDASTMRSLPEVANLPALTFVGPVYVLEPARVRVPVPAFVMPKPPPPMTPPRARVLSLTVTVRLAPSVIAPVVCVRLAVPVKVRSAPSATALVIVAATAASRVPPSIFSRPAVPPLPPKA